MKYSESYISSHDIDWFCMVNGVYLHIASAGGWIPDQINEKEKLRIIQHQVELLENIPDDEIEYNDEAIERVVNDTFRLERTIERRIARTREEIREQYLASFIAMARKGFASFDKTDIENLEDGHYHLVCKPRNMTRKPEGLDETYLEIENVRCNENTIELYDDNGDGHRIIILDRV